MIDWHSHILPQMDDGSRDTAESISLLKMLVEQGVDTVVATPHFYANDESVDDFLKRREISLNNLKEELFEDAPKILCGAEVKYYSGISRMSELEKLAVENSGLLLLEMPFSRWTEYTVRELVELSGHTDLTVVLAHIERYLSFQSRDVWERLYDSEILMQANATFFTKITTRRKALSLLKNDMIHFIGSDCHNLSARPPFIGKAFEIIKDKLGDDFIKQINEYGYSILAKKL